MNRKEKNKIPKNVWFLWFQGYENAPLLVKKCWETWKKHNPDWNLVFLCEANLSQYIDLDPSAEHLSKLGMVQKSDLVRLQLLYKHGGIWVDSTCFCTKPLNSWIDSYFDSGFFAFRNPGRDRLLSNWFLAASKDNIIAYRLYELLFAYFTTNEYRNVYNDKPMKLLAKFLCRTTKTTKFWFNPLFTKILKFYPHYCFHYLFKELIDRDVECRNIWDNTPELPADPCHAVVKQMHDPLNINIKQSIDNQNVPVYKLNHKKYDKYPVNEESIIHYLLETA